MSLTHLAHSRAQPRVQGKISERIVAGLAMNTLSLTSGLMLCTAVALTTLLATESTTCPLRLSDEVHTDGAKPRWLPWLVMIGVGVATGVVAVLHPLSFAAAFGQALP